MARSSTAVGGVPASQIPPLRDWPAKWYQDGIRLITGMKRHQRKLIAQEYYRYDSSVLLKLSLTRIWSLGSNEEVFIKTYPTTSQLIGTIIKAIRESNKKLGLSQSRRSKRGLRDESD